MRAVLISRVGEVPTIAEVPEPVCPPDGVVVAVRATGLCRSDWHAWLGHEDIALPHVPGHEFAGVVDEVGTEVSGWSVGDRVTAPFVYACGRCGPCRIGDQQVCDAQEQPGFTRWGSFAERVVVTRAQTNLVRLPPGLDFAAAAALGCRFATAYRAVVTQGRLAAGETLVVHGCGGVGLSAIQIGLAVGAQVVGVDPSPGGSRGGRASWVPDPPRRPRRRGLRSAERTSRWTPTARRTSAAAAYASLGKRGRHIQVGLLVGDAAAFPRLDLARAIAEELEIRGSHGMAAHEYPAMLARIAAGELDPGRSIGRRVRLEDLPAALAAMSDRADRRRDDRRGTGLSRRIEGGRPQPAVESWLAASRSIRSASDSW